MVLTILNFRIGLHCILRREGAEGNDPMANIRQFVSVFPSLIREISRPIHERAERERERESYNAIILNLLQVIELSRAPWLQ